MYTVFMPFWKVYFSFPCGLSPLEHLTYFGYSKPNQSDVLQFLVRGTYFEGFACFCETDLPLWFAFKLLAAGDFPLSIVLPVWKLKLGEILFFRNPTESTNETRARIQTLRWSDYNGIEPGNLYSYVLFLSSWCLCRHSFPTPPFSVHLAISATT